MAQNTTTTNNGDTVPSTKWNHGMDYSIEESKTNKNMKKNVVKINENTLRQIVAESVKKVLTEAIETGPYGQPIYSPRAPEGSDNGIEGYPDRSRMPKDLGKHPVVKHQWKNGYYDMA